MSWRVASVYLLKRQRAAPAIGLDITLFARPKVKKALGPFSVFRGLQNESFRPGENQCRHSLDVCGYRRALDVHAHLTLTRDGEDCPTPAVRYVETQPALFRVG